MKDSAKRRPRKKSQPDPGQYLYPLEDELDLLVTPFEEFIAKQTTSGVILIITSLLVLVLANSPLGDAYERFVHLPVSVGVGAWSIELTLIHLINDGLMAFFFFVIGLEIKREVLVGELADPRRAALPVIAAAGGMAAPALIYFLINGSGDYAAGWGIPMATDIAFSVSVLVLLGRRIPRELVMFLVTAAIADDLGAVIVITVFYASQVDTSALGVAFGLFTVLVTFNIAGVRRGLPYLAVGALLWYFLLYSGVDAAVGGILVAFCIPARARSQQEASAERIGGLLERFRASHKKGEQILANVEQYSILHDLDHEVRLAEAPVQRMLHIFHLPTALLIIPAFAFVNAGIPVDVRLFAGALAHPVTWGIVVSQIAGKFAGITAFTMLGARLGLALPAGVGLRHVMGVGILAGMGFTMSMFIADLSFAGRPETLTMAKTGIFLASIIAGVAGYLWLRIVPGLKRKGAGGADPDREEKG